MRPTRVEVGDDYTDIGADRKLYGGQRLYVSGCTSAGAAKKDMKKLIEGMEALGKPKGLGPLRTTVCVAT